MLIRTVQALFDASEPHVAVFYLINMENQQGMCYKTHYYCTSVDQSESRSQVFAGSQDILLI